MNEDTSAFLCGFLASGVLFAFVVTSCNDAAWRRQAVEHHAAEFVIVNTNNGTAKFIWKQ
jgi:hypothetical protein